MLSKDHNLFRCVGSEFYNNSSLIPKDKVQYRTVDLQIIPPSQRDAVNIPKDSTLLNSSLSSENFLTYSCLYWLFQKKTSTRPKDPGHLSQNLSTVQSGASRNYTRQNNVKARFFVGS